MEGNGPLWIGAFFGLVIVYMQRWFIISRKNARRQKAIDIAMMSRLDSVAIQKLCQSNFPPWVSFPEFQRVKWLNTQLKEMWPFLNKAASTIIKELVEPKLEQYRPVVIKSILFDKLTLGDIAPQLGGIKFKKVAENRVSIDIDIKWGGDPNIVLAIASGGIGIVNIPVQLTDLEFFATARVMLEFAEKVPCVGAVVFSLLAKPKPVVKYQLKAVGGNVSAIPGLNGIVDDIIHNILDNQVIWPKRVVKAIIPGYKVDHLLLKIQGRLTVTVVRASGLKNVDLIGKSDPYAVVWTTPLAKEQTKCISNDLNPVWNETFELDVDEHTSSVFHIAVQDEGLLMNDSLGLTQIPVSGLYPDKEVEVTHFLSPKNTQGVPFNKDRGLGSITLKLQYHPFSNEEQEEVMEAAKEIQECKKNKKPILASSASKLQSLQKRKFRTAVNAVKLAGGSVTGAAKMGLSGIGTIGTGAAMMGFSGLNSMGKVGFAATQGSISRVFKGPLQSPRTSFEASSGPNLV